MTFRFFSIIWYHLSAIYLSCQASRSSQTICHALSAAIQSWWRWVRCSRRGCCGRRRWWSVAAILLLFLLGFKDLLNLFLILRLHLSPHLSDTGLILLDLSLTILIFFLFFCSFLRLLLLLIFFFFLLSLLLLFCFLLLSFLFSFFGLFLSFLFLSFSFKGAKSNDIEDSP